jgi:class 3 adenylate cyclase
MDWDAFKPMLTPLGFAPQERFNVTIGGITYHTLMNDFGPSSIDGWLAKLIGIELGVESIDYEVAKPSNRSGRPDGRKLLTVLFTDIVGSTQKAVEMGDRRWRELLENHHRIVRQNLDEFQGREVDSAGDGFFAVFDKPVSAINCASSIGKAVSDIGLRIRSGLHLGKCEVIENAVRGITVHIGARVASKAKPGQILVSSTLKEAIAGSDINFGVSGSPTLKGIPGKWSLFAVKKTSSHNEMP